MKEKARRSNRLITLLTVAGLFLVLPQIAMGAAYIKFDGVDGESQDKDHRNWSPIHSFQLGMARETGTTGTVRGEVKIDDILVTKELDKSSPKLMEACVTGETTGSVILSMTRGGAEPRKYMTVELKNVVITSVQVSGRADDTVPTETISLNFEEIKVTYTPQGLDGSSGEPVIFSWNIVTNTPGG